MGCSHSASKSPSPKVAPKTSQAKEKATQNRAKREISHPCQSMFQDLKIVMSGVTKLPRPPTISFVSCLSTSSLPLAISPISYDEGEPSSISLPIVGIARFELGRIICMGNIEILTDCKPENAEYLAFLENILQFAAGPRPVSPLVLLLGIDPQDAELLQHNMGGLGFGFDKATEVADLSKYSIVFAMSDCIYGEEIYEFIKNGGGFFCFASLEPGGSENNCYKYQMNRYLSKSGMAFPAKFVELPPTKKASMRTTVRATELERSTFPFIVNCFKDLLTNDRNPDPIEMSTIITYLRFNILCFEREHNDLFLDIFKSSYEFLEETKFRQPDGIFFSDSQRKIAILLSDLFSKFSPEDFVELAEKLNDPFPGLPLKSSEEIEPKRTAVELRLTIQSVNWHSTGIWLPAGEISEVTIDPPNISDVSIQIGSHSESLLESVGPWKRWPVVTQVFPIDFEKKTMEIASPFGGLIYIINHTQRKPQKIRFRFTNVMKSVIYMTDQMTKSDNNKSDNSKSDNNKSDNNKSDNNSRNKNRESGISRDNYSLRNSAKNLLANSTNPSLIKNSIPKNMPPWGEIQTKYVCFTLPTKDIDKVGNIEKFGEFFDKLVEEVMVFTGFKPKRRFRIVFDVDLPEAGSVSSYPLMMREEMIEGILIMNEDEPSSELYAALMMIGIVSLPEGSLDPNVEAAFGALAAAHTFVKNWPEVSPTDYTYIHMSPLFLELWEIYKNNDKKLISNALSHFHQAQLVEVTPYEKSISFIINEMSTIADKDFSSLLESALNISNLSTQRFPSYKCLCEEEDESGV